jgi:hypothetical protein
MDALPIGITPIKITELFGGACWLYRFDNGYGASVALHGMSYGHEDAQFELLLTKFTFPHGSSWGQPDVAMIESISQSEPGGDDHGLWGWLTIEDVARILGVITLRYNGHSTGIAYPMVNGQERTSRLGRQIPVSGVSSSQVIGTVTAD